MHLPDIGPTDPEIGKQDNHAEILAERLTVLIRALLLRAPPIKKAGLTLPGFFIGYRGS
jgi:hypothetical protein